MSSSVHHVEAKSLHSVLDVIHRYADNMLHRICPLFGMQKKERGGGGGTDFQKGKFYSLQNLEDWHSVLKIT